ILEILNQAIETALLNKGHAAPILQNTFAMTRIPKLSDIPLDRTITDEEYEKELSSLQKKLGKLHNELYLRQIPVIICYEGWDAAGKGGNIKRITEALDARGYEVNPIASPEPHEKARHFLWRFWMRLPRTGHIAIFDRTWYGRVMVERIEGFCTEAEWKRAYEEINSMERDLTDAGAIVLKFWMQIDKDEQEKRFRARQENPEKQWKITDEDWRNREKWDKYETAVNEMLVRTSTVNAPWIVVEGNSKYYARIKVLESVVNAIEERLKKEDAGK
ncbi:MAG: phosphate--AMP phosphotransferase, partial [Lachnoclostridium sp.]|nr:phosphate--AMP phosphotransferase [Lachnoclostridium sp.]